MRHNGLVDERDCFDTKRFAQGYTNSKDNEEVNGDKIL